ncbi:MAG: DnaB-like helicase C-terminal domain-containing protein, partial [Muribaculaceae bacterium]|nr:DnaB-like helicase C-terminal domain-containing protein [Muribaculaceae bacterium]
MSNNKISYVLTDLDRLTGGLQLGQLLTITGRPAMGKTAFAITLIMNIGFKQRIPVAFFSIEMSEVQIYERILKNCGIYKSDCLSDDSEDFNPSDYRQELCKLAESPIYIDDTPSISIDDMEGKIANLISNYGVKVVFIDYLQLINGFEVNPDNIMKRLKGIAINHGISIVIISQLYKDYYPLKPYDSDSDEDFFRGATNDIMNNSDSVILLYRHDYYTPIEDYVEHQIKAEAIILKGNNEQIETVPLTFLPEFA